MENQAEATIPQWSVPGQKFRIFETSGQVLDHDPLQIQNVVHHKGEVTLRRLQQHQDGFGGVGMIRRQIEYFIKPESAAVSGPVYSQIRRSYAPLTGFPTKVVRIR